MYEAMRTPSRSHGRRRVVTHSAAETSVISSTSGGNHSYTARKRTGPDVVPLPAELVDRGLDPCPELLERLANPLPRLPCLASGIAGCLVGSRAKLGRPALEVLVRLFRLVPCE